MPLIHDMIRAERCFSLPVERLFGAWGDPDQLGIWPFQVHEEIDGRLEHMDFRDGGSKRMVYGDPFGTRYVEDAVYLRILKYHQITMMEQVSNGGRLLAAALTSLEFFSEGSGSRLFVTDQVMIFEPRYDLDARRNGWERILDTVAAYLGDAQYAELSYPSAKHFDSSA